MRLRRCHALMIEPRETRELDIAAVFAGQARMRSRIEWMALAAHRDDPVRLSEAEVLALGEVPSRDWVEGDALVDRHGEAVVNRLLDTRLLESDAAPDADDAIVREGHWHRIAAVAHRHLRWHDTDTQQTPEALEGDKRCPRCWSGSGHHHHRSPRASMPLTGSPCRPVLPPTSTGWCRAG